MLDARTYWCQKELWYTLCSTRRRNKALTHLYTRDYRHQFLTIWLDDLRLSHKECEYGFTYTISVDPPTLLLTILIWMSQHANWLRLWVREGDCETRLKFFRWEKLKILSRNNSLHVTYGDFQGRSAPSAAKLQRLSLTLWYHRTSKFISPHSQALQNHWSRSILPSLTLLVIYQHRYISIAQRGLLSPFLFDKYLTSLTFSTTHIKCDNTLSTPAYMWDTGLIHQTRVSTTTLSHTLSRLVSPHKNCYIWALRCFGIA